MDYVLHLACLIGIYVILSASLNFAVGQAGVVSVAHASFYGIGAYGTAILMRDHHWGFTPAVLLGAGIAAAAGLVVSGISSRLGAEMLVLTTFAFAVVLTSVATNWSDLTGGPSGVPGIPDAVVGGSTIKPGPGMTTLIVVTAAAVTLILKRLTDSPFGRVLRCVREDPLLAMSMGKSVTGARNTACAISAFLAGIAGGLFAIFSGFIDPTSFTVTEGIFILSIVVVGGSGSTLGASLAAVLLIGAPELIRLAGVSGPAAANIRQIIYGAILVGLMLWRPRGLLGKFTLGEA